MTSKRQRAASAIALVLIFSISQIYVQASLAGKSSAATNPAGAAAARTGKLTTSGNNPINVNGNSTKPGTTILPGSTLLTPAGVGASVQIGKLGLLRMAPETSLTLNFDGSSVDVTLATGYATLTTGPGVKGSITTPDGKTERTDSAKLSTITGQSDDQTKDDDDDDKKKAAGILGSGSDEGVGVLGGISNDAARAFGLIVLGGATAAAVIVVATDDRGDNPSTLTPH
jgi:hypothetical protein